MTLAPEQVLEALRNLAEAGEHFKKSLAARDPRDISSFKGFSLAREWIETEVNNTDFPALLAAVEGLVRERLALAMLAADTPMFNNPMDAWAAKEIRDRVLKQSTGDTECHSR